MNSTTSTSSYEPSLKPWIQKSLIFHAVVLAVLTVRALVFPTEPIQIENTIRVDLVALPDKNPQLAEAEPMETKPQTPPTPAPTVNPVKETTAMTKPTESKAGIPKKVSATQAALDRLKALNKIEESISEEEKKKKLAEIEKARSIKGNMLAKGNSLTGLNRIQYEKYFSEIKNHAMKQWNLPEWLAKGNYRTVVSVKIDDRGNVIEKRITQSSGNQQYDELALTSIERASPFPQPPEKFRDMLSERGMLLGFPD